MGKHKKHKTSKKKKKKKNTLKEIYFKFRNARCTKTLRRFHKTNSQDVQQQIMHKAAAYTLRSVRNLIQLSDNSLKK